MYKLSCSSAPRRSLQVKKQYAAHVSTWKWMRDINNEDKVDRFFWRGEFKGRSRVVDDVHAASHHTGSVYFIWLVFPSDTQVLCNFHHQQFCNNTSKRWHVSLHVSRCKCIITLKMWHPHWHPSEPWWIWRSPPIRPSCAVCVCVCGRITCYCWPANEWAIAPNFYCSLPRLCWYKLNYSSFFLFRTLSLFFFFSLFLYTRLFTLSVILQWSLSLRQAMHLGPAVLFHLITRPGHWHGPHHSS